MKVRLVTLALILTSSHSLNAFAHTGSHESGAQTNGQWHGAYAEIEVTNADVPSGTSAHYFANIYGFEAGTAPSCGNQGVNESVHLGWIEAGFDVVNGQPRRSIFSYQWSGISQPVQLGCAWQFYDDLFDVTVGSKITVRMVPDSTCAGGSSSCFWNLELNWNGVWVNLDSVLMVANYSLYLMEYGNAHTASTAHWNIAGTSQGSNVNWDNTRLRNSVGNSLPWSSSISTCPFHTAPYYLGWGQTWNYFNMHRDNPQTVPPCT